MSLAPNLLMSVAQAAMALAESDRAAVSLHQERCIHYADKTSTCEICIKACPVDAIQIEEGDSGNVVAHDLDECVRCGLCLRVCPVEAFTGDNGVSDLLAFVARQEKRGIVELSCALHPDREHGPSQSHLVINTGACLAAIGPSAITSLLAIGVGHVILRADVCDSCPLSKSKSEIVKAVEQVRNLLTRRQDIISPVTLLEQARSDFPARKVASIKAPPRSRRDFFRAFTGPASIPEEIQFLLRVESPDEDKHPPSERVRLIRALKALDEDLRSSEPLASFRTSLLVVDDSCAACGVCDRACPTGAIQYVEDDGDSFTLAFDAGSCTDCGICSTYCEPDALKQEGFPKVADWISGTSMVLRKGKLKQCARCGVHFAESVEGDLCPVCAFRISNPFGIRMPAGFERQKNAHD